MELFNSAVSFISKIATVLPFVIGLVFFNRLSVIQRRLFVLVAFSLVVEIIAHRYFISRIWEHVFGKYTNLPLLHLFTVLQFLLLLWCYRELLDRNLGPKMFWLLGSGFLVFGIVNAIWIDGIFYLNPHARLGQSLILMPIAISYLVELLRRMEMTKLERDPLFWISVAVIIYFAGSLLIFLTSNYMLAQQEVLKSIYVIHSVLNVIALILYTITLWIKPQTLQPSQ